MGETTKIQWCDHTFNGWIGCDKVDKTCQKCYAEQSTPTRVQRSKGIELWGRNGVRHRTSALNWRQPYLWNKEAAFAGQTRRVFCASLSDVFENRPELVAWRSDLWQMICATPALTWLCLTKRPQHVPTYWNKDHGANPWIGTSLGDKSGLPRIDALRRVKSDIRFLSIEPLIEGLEKIDLRGISWVIVGGESGPNARPCFQEWIRSILWQCREAGVACFVKQLGANVIGPAAHVPGAYQDPPVRHVFADKKGGDMAAWPDDLRVREFPRTEAR